MDTFPEGTQSPLARAVAAEVRGRLAAQRVTLREFAAEAGFNSHNYVAIRLRDEKPFTVDDVERISRYFDEDPVPFLKAAYDNHLERIWGDLHVLSRQLEQGNLVHLSAEEHEQLAGMGSGTVMVSTGNDPVITSGSFAHGTLAPRPDPEVEEALASAARKTGRKTERERAAAAINEALDNARGQSEEGADDETG